MNGVKIELDMVFISNRNKIAIYVKNVLLGVKMLYERNAVALKINSHLHIRTTNNYKFAIFNRSSGVTFSEVTPKCLSQEKRTTRRLF